MIQTNRNQVTNIIGTTKAATDKVFDFQIDTATAFSITTAGEVSVGSAAILTGTSTPEAAVTAAVGSIFLRTDGGASTTLYVKESGAGNTGWVAK